MCGFQQYVDDISGAPLDSKLVHEARADEIKGAEKCGVWTKVPLSECYARTGKQPVGTRWVDINKGDEGEPNYRSRLVGREFNNKKIDGLFAATPPLEAIRALISLAASQCGRNGPVKKLSFIDIKEGLFSCQSQQVSLCFSSRRGRSSARKG